MGPAGSNLAQAGPSFPAAHLNLLPNPRPNEPTSLSSRSPLPSRRQRDPQPDPHLPRACSSSRSLVAATPPSIPLLLSLVFCRRHTLSLAPDPPPPAATSSAGPAAERRPLFGPASRVVPVAIVHPVTGARRLYLTSAPACFASPCSSCTDVRGSKSSTSIVRPKVRRGHGRTQLRCPVPIGADLHRRGSVVAALLLCCLPGPTGGRASPR